MVSVYTVPARGGRSCERSGGYKTINRIPFVSLLHNGLIYWLWRNLLDSLYQKELGVQCCMLFWSKMLTLEELVSQSIPEVG